jgi:hypothetical protein
MTVGAEVAVTVAGKGSKWKMVGGHRKMLWGASYTGVIFDAGHGASIWHTSCSLASRVVCIIYGHGIGSFVSLLSLSFIIFLAISQSHTIISYAWYDD